MNTERRFFSPDNFEDGFLVDGELLGGIAKVENSDKKPLYSAYIVSQQSGECIDYRVFETAELAIEYLGAIDRPWSFETTKNCGNGSCGNGTCGSGCGVGASGCKSC